MKIIGGSDQSDPIHWRNHFDVCPTINLDGQTLHHVCEADDRDGYVVVVCYGPDGKLQSDASGENILTKRLQGTVEIIPNIKSSECS